MFHLRYVNTLRQFRRDFQFIFLFFIFPPIAGLQNAKDHKLEIFTCHLPEPVASRRDCSLTTFSIPQGSIPVYASIKGICKEESERVISVVCCARRISFKLHFK